MRAFGSLRIASILVIIFLSLAACMPSKDGKADYPDDAEYDDESATNDGEEQSEAKPNRPVIVRSQSVIVEARPGDTVQLPCLVDNLEDDVINWLKDNEMIFIDNKAVIDDEDGRFTRADNFSLIIRNVTEKDSSDGWHCQILSQIPGINLYHKLHVFQKPRELSTRIRVIPNRRVETNESATVTFGCETTDEPKREIRWSHKGKRLSSNDKIEIKENFVTIKKVSMHDVGLYQCLVEDNSENPPNDEIELIVGYAPRIDVERQVVHTGSGRRSELVCAVHAHPHAKVTWLKGDGKPIIDNRERTQILESKSHRTLIIERTTKEDLGHYTCKARNRFGETSRMIELTGAPSRPRIHGGEVPDDEPTLIIKWHVESFAPIVEYLLEYRETNKKEWQRMSPQVTDGIGNQFTVEFSLEKLEPASYETKLKARNDYGWSQYSDIHTFRQGYKSERVENVKGSAVTRHPFWTLTAILVLFVTSYESSCV